MGMRWDEQCLLLDDGWAKPGEAQLDTVCTADHAHGGQCAQCNALVPAEM